MRVCVVALAVCLSHVVRPRSFQASDILTIDLFERGGSRSARVSTIKSPFLREDGRRDCQEEENLTYHTRTHRPHSCSRASVTLVPPSGNDYHVFPSRISSAKCSLARKASAMIVSVTDFSG